MPTSASRSAIDCSVACRMFVLAPWPRTRRCFAHSGRTRRAETSPFSGVARNFSSRASWGMSGVLPERMGEAETHAVGVFGEEDTEGLTSVLLLGDDSWLDPFRVELSPQGVHVSDGEPAARLLGIPPVDRQTDHHVVPLQPGGRLVLRGQREAEALRVVADGRADLLDRQGVRVRVADGAGCLEEHPFRHGPPPQWGFSTPFKSRAHGNSPAFW